jgi:hypothetical protein
LPKIYKKGKKYRKQNSKKKREINLHFATTLAGKEMLHGNEKGILFFNLLVPVLG